MKEGVTSWLPTTLTLSPKVLEDVCASVAEYMKNQEFAKTPGVHLEGPFINPKCCGAQNPAFVRQPDYDEVANLNAAAVSLTKKDLENATGLFREDLYSGGELIEVYKKYLLSGDEHLLVGDGRIDLAVVVDDRVDHLGHAVGWGVGQDRLAEVFHSLKVGRGGGNIGLADVQVVEFLALFGSLVCIGRELAHRREAAFFDLTGKFHVAPPFFLCIFGFFFALKHIHDNAFFPKLQLIFWKKPVTNLTITPHGEGKNKRPPQLCAAAAGAYLVSMRAQTLKSTEVAP